MKLTMVKVRISNYNCRLMLPLKYPYVVLCFLLTQSVCSCEKQVVGNISWL